uniref:NADH-ubiquinone oxidoreductase chain 6 n=1 Tax=Pseudolebinthus lunipterus TaxID=2681891 RepID=A0A650BX76_9ORTH|nr:NADH dehydrogenase subunit 6 [Pseudolebinthus sp. 1 RN-2019]
MNINILMIIMITLNTLFLLMTHPLASTLLIILQTINICMMLGPLFYSFWFSYILFMIFLGGMLVLFIYITSLASNEMFHLPNKSMLITLMISIIMLIMLYSTKHNQFNYNMKNDQLNSSFIMIISTENPTNLYQLYNIPNVNLTLLTIMYLLITLIILVKMTQIQEGPLRQMNN